LRTKRILVWLGAGLAAAAFLNLRLGSVWIPPDAFWDALRGDDPVYGPIVYGYRLPKLMMALLTGSGLALAGLLLQTMFRNPIAGPYVLGISSGAGLGVALLMVAGAGLGWHLPWSVEFWGAVAGSAAVLGIDRLLYRKIPRPEGLLIAGMMIGALAGAVLQILMLWMPDPVLRKYFLWTAGRLGNIPAAERIAVAMAVFAAYAWALYRIKDLNQLLLGEGYAKAAGIDVRRLRLEIMWVTGGLAGVLTAAAGPVAFVGLIVPHLTRLMTGSWLHQTVIPGAALTGALFMTVADLVSQLPGHPGTLPLNSITALVGAPWVIHLLWRRMH